MICKNTFARIADLDTPSKRIKMGENGRVKIVGANRYIVAKLYWRR